MTSTTTNDPLLTPQQAAEYLQVNERWVYDKIQAKVLPHSRVGKFIRLRRSDLDAYVESMRVEAVPTSGPMIRTSPGLRAAALKGSAASAAAAGRRAAKSTEKPPAHGR